MTGGGAATVAVDVSVCVRWGYCGVCVCVCVCQILYIYVSGTIYVCSCQGCVMNVSGVSESMIRISVMYSCLSH